MGCSLWGAVSLEEAWVRGWGTRHLPTARGAPPPAATGSQLVMGDTVCAQTPMLRRNRQSKNAPGRAFWKCDIFLHVKILGGSDKYLDGMDLGIFMRKDLVHFLLLTYHQYEWTLCISSNLMCNHQFVLKCHKYSPIKTAQHNALYFIKQLLAVIVRSKFPFFIWILIWLFSVQNVKSIRHRFKWTRKSSWEDGIMPVKEVHVLMTRTCDATLHGKETLGRWLNNGFWDEETFLNYQRGPMQSRGSLWEGGGRSGGHGFRSQGMKVALESGTGRTWVVSWSLQKKGSSASSWS